MHLHAAVNQKCHNPHAGKKNTKFVILWDVKQDAGALTSEARGKLFMQKVEDFCKAEQSAGKKGFLFFFFNLIESLTLTSKRQK